MASVESERAHEQAHDDMQECIEECLNCHAVCTMTLQHCIATGGDHTEVNLIGILLDCAEMCHSEWLYPAPYSSLPICAIRSHASAQVAQTSPQ